MPGQGYRRVTKAGRITRRKRRRRLAVCGYKRVIPNLRQRARVGKRPRERKGRREGGWRGPKEVSDLLTGSASFGVPATSQEFPKWRSRHHPPLSLSFRCHNHLPTPLRPTWYSPFKHPTTPSTTVCVVGSSLFAPFADPRWESESVREREREKAGMQPLLSLNGVKVNAAHVPRAAEHAPFNWDVWYARLPRVYRQNWDAVEFRTTSRRRTRD